ncbi:MAG TPA: CPBP family intramembrane metalloprotease [Candidatus Alectryocaccobium stercorigallinarum]|jgi:membrane protease YdiL (CAAX protease family)|nr:CPBP family intramembrane metalloprotease [Candidatus Alectryocaccobium stercorigallinarum]
MVDRSEVPLKNKIWEMISPFAFFLVCMVICIFIVYLIAGVIYESSPSEGVSFENYVLSQSLWCYLAFYVAALFVKGSRKSRAYESVKYGHENRNWKLIYCILAAAAAFFAALVISRLLSASGIEDVFTTYSTAEDTAFAGKPAILLIITTVIAGPLAEELIFRYMTFGRMRCYIGSRWAVILSALLFGIYHTNMVQFIYCTILGIIFAVIYDKSGNLWITVGAHMAINLASVVAYF